jgi:hypothetical protein
MCHIARVSMQAQQRRWQKAVQWRWQPLRVEELLSCTTWRSLTAASRTRPIITPASSFFQGTQIFVNIVLSYNFYGIVATSSRTRTVHPTSALSVQVHINMPILISTKASQVLVCTSHENIPFLHTLHNASSHEMLPLHVHCYHC